MRTKRTTSNNQDFLLLIKLLDKELWTRYPELQHQYEPHVKIDYLETVIVLYKEMTAIGCGCFIVQDSETVELKRIFVHPQHRRKGISPLLMRELESWASSMGYKTSVLETGFNQPEAVALYKKLGYQITERYGPYKDMEESLCFTKNI